MRRTVRPLIAIGSSVALVALVIAALGASPLSVLTGLFDGAFGNSLACADTLVKATPLIFCGLAVAIAFKGSLWNIGADGQLIAGAIVAGACGPALQGWPHVVAVLMMLSAGVVGGALWGGFAGWLRAQRDVSEVISTIMLNIVAAQLLSWVVHGPLIERSRAFPKSTPIASAAELHLYFAPSRLHLGMVIALLAAVLCYLLAFHTEFGFKLRATARNPGVAAFFGISKARICMVTMALSGALAGLGGAIHVAAITHRLYETLSPGWGYEAIAVALVARLNPLAIIPSAIFFGALDNGAQAMQRTAGISPVLVQVIEALAIMILLIFDCLTPRTLIGIERADTPTAQPAYETLDA